MTWKKFHLRSIDDKPIELCFELETVFKFYNLEARSRSRNYEAHLIHNDFGRTFVMIHTPICAQYIF